MRPALALACLVAVCGAAQAQPVYRCGADGRSYSQIPCAGGQAVGMMANPPSAERQSEAATVTQRTQQLVMDMERDRQARESQPAAAAAHIGSRRAATPDDAPPKPRQRSKRPTTSSTGREDFRAVAPGPRPAHRKQGQRG